MEYTNTILIVDDSQLMLKVLSQLIKKAGHQVLCADSGEEALNFFDGRDIDLVITDLNMPGMDGTGLIGHIRVKDYYNYTPVILFVADDETERKKLLETSGSTMLFDKVNIKGKIIPAIKKMVG